MRTSARAVAALLGVSSLGLLGALAWSQPSRQVVSAAPPRASASSSDDVEQLRLQVASMERALSKARRAGDSATLEALRAQLDQMEKRLDAISARDERERLEDEPGLSEVELRARERAHTEQLIASLERHFREQPRDPRAAQEIETAIARTLKQETGLTPKQLSCQGNLCKVQMDHGSGEAERLFLHKLVHVRELGDTEAYSERQEHDDGTITTLTYVAASGGHLPDPDPL